LNTDLETVSSAQARLLDSLSPLRTETVSLDRALGRILAEAVVAGTDFPAFDNSAMDGYAVRAVDIASASRDQPVTLPVHAESRPGAVPPDLLGGTAMRIMTGAQLPHGADTVVKQEDCRRDGPGVTIDVAARQGTDVRRRGDDMRAGMVVLMPGRELTSVDVGVAAALSRSHLQVGRRPRVAVLATGDELVPAGSELGAAQVIDSNSPMLVAAVQEAGGEPVQLGISEDTPDAIRGLLDGARGCDVIVSSAGVSVGDHDHVRAVVAELGEIMAWRVAMRPGKPLLIGNVRGALYLGLPGNPVSSSVTFELFARPAIRKLQGAAEPHRRRFPVRLGEDIQKPAGLETYTRAVLQSVDGNLPVATSSGGQGSAMLHSLAAADCLLVLPAEPSVVQSGSVVEAIPLR
jgi:molybdopterin molybdotransferase